MSTSQQVNKLTSSTASLKSCTRTSSSTNPATSCRFQYWSGKSSITIKTGKFCCQFFFREPQRRCLRRKDSGQITLHLFFGGSHIEGNHFLVHENGGRTSEVVSLCFFRVGFVDLKIKLIPEFLLHRLGHACGLLA